MTNIDIGPECGGRRMGAPHATRVVSVLVDADIGIADMVEYLQTIPGVRTLASCQGTIGEGGPHPYPPQVLATWPPAARVQLDEEFDVTELGACWGCLHPKGSPRGCQCAECKECYRNTGGSAPLHSSASANGDAAMEASHERA